VILNNGKTFYLIWKLRYDGLGLLNSDLGIGLVSSIRYVSRSRELSFWSWSNHTSSC